MQKLQLALCGDVQVHCTSIYCNVFAWAQPEFVTLMFIDTVVSDLLSGISSAFALIFIVPGILLTLCCAYCCFARHKRKTRARCPMPSRFAASTPGAGTGRHTTQLAAAGETAPPVSVVQTPPPYTSGNRQFFLSWFLHALYISPSIRLNLLLLHAHVLCAHVPHVFHVYFACFAVYIVV